MSEKLNLLEELDEVILPPKGIDVKYFLYILLSIAFVCLLLFPKLYIQQQIYYKSIKIDKLSREYSTLKEENRLIKESVESIKFKNQILDTLF